MRRLYSKNRDRLVAGDVAARLLQAVLQGERVRRLLSEGALLGRRHADRGLGVDEELPPQGIPLRNRLSGMFWDGFGIGRC